MRELVTDSHPNGLGELVRSLVFTGDGYGCYTTFDFHPQARVWDEGECERFWLELGWCDDEEARFYANCGSGCTLSLEGLRIDACYYWDGDGVLCFRLFGEDGRLLREIVNSDCKKSYEWRELRPALCRHAWERRTPVYEDLGENALFYCGSCHSYVEARSPKEAGALVAARGAQSVHPWPW
jgi:hypothetical protein